MAQTLAKVACRGLAGAALLALAGWAGTTTAAVPIPGLGAEQASSQSPPELPPELSREQARELVSRMGDDQVRALLLRQLDALATRADGGASRQQPQGIVEALHARIQAIQRGLETVLAAGPQLALVPGELASKLTVGGTVGGLAVTVQLLLSLLFGWGAERLFRRLTTYAGRYAGRSGTASSSRVGALAIRGVIESIEIGVFALVAVAAMCLLVADNDAAAVLFMGLLGAIVMLRLVALLSELILAPRRQAHRPIRLSDAGAAGLHRRIVGLAAVLIPVKLIVLVMSDLAFSPDVIALTRLSLTTVPILVLIAMVWEARAPVSHFIRGSIAEERPGSDAGFRDAFAANWHVLATVYIAIIGLMAAVSQVTGGALTEAPGLLSIGLIVSVVLLDAVLQRLVARYFAPSDDAGTHPALAGEARSSASTEYQPVVVKNLRILLAVATVLLFAAIWDIDLAAISDRLIGARSTAALFHIGVTVLLAYAVWGIVKTAVERHVGPERDAAAAVPGEGGEGGGAGATRLETLLPLFRKFVSITLIVMVVMIGLSSLGLDVGPLLAGAGMVGIAIGFGAQTLVRDVISGLFFLLDDAFRMGEYVEIDNIRGTVEKISVRSLQFRHHQGPVHTLPFGEIKHVTNYSRDWAIMKFELRLPFETDIEKVRKVIKRVGLEMLEDPEYGSKLLGPLKSQGVNRMDDSALIVRCKFTAVPGEQFVLRREAFTRIQTALAEQGIHFAPRRVIVEAAPATGAVPASALQAAAGALDRDDEGAAAPAAADDRG